MDCCRILPDGDLKIMEIIIEILGEITDFILDLWINKVKKRKK